MSSEQETSESAPQGADTSISAPPRRRWLKRCGIALLVVFVTVALLHRRLLGCAYHLLTSEDDKQRVSLVVISSADRLGLDQAQQLVADGTADAILIAEPRMPRVAKIGLVMRPAILIRQELVARGVADSSIQLLATGAKTPWEIARQLDAYLQREHNDAAVALLCSQHNTRKLRWVVDHTIAPSRISQYRVWSFPPGGFNAGNWWTSRGAVNKVAASYLRLLHVIAFGEGEFHMDDWSEDQYEQSIGRRVTSKAA